MLDCKYAQTHLEMSDISYNTDIFNGLYTKNVKMGNLIRR